MAIREKAKALFKSKSKGDGGSQISKSSTKESDTERWPSNVYKPGETMPRPKYRAPPKKEHKESLEAFSFAEAWRRKSFQSQYSPMGTRAPSRRNSSRQPSRRSSWYSMGKKSYGGKSDVVRNGSVTSGEAEKGGTRQREHVSHAAKATTLKTEMEQEGDDDVGNVGLSRVQSKDMAYKSRPTSMDVRAEQERDGAQYHGMDTTLSTAHDHHPFTEQELALALSRSHLSVPVHS
ncbi:unnamed protein product [Zymoseptoria tritici ST99CH_1A5]|uniref:Uncharacterized protein n=3 Tax=Zymoseptoria tritici TaxID=1047171 RepID=A0A1X7S4P3_ZYMT9|nr:unnamed protein product [Zymoseptoria tritici ST99CH_3D7]SMR59079.1 unnamed protein product [Zymoseptoria tritici ST99CH_1E4]SMR62918.1 unnamed protein product [Zymoseptoria tritici ST99CH_3D1]SMY28289.1 unnamed protein product [Zymoseptoria tritici ST99CH_1A5]